MSYFIQKRLALHMSVRRIATIIHHYIKILQSNLPQKCQVKPWYLTWVKFGGKTRGMVCLAKCGLWIATLFLTLNGLQAGVNAKEATDLSSVSTNQASAGSNALIDVLVKKGILTNDEAQGIEEDLLQQEQAHPGGFLQLGSKADIGLLFYGDARLRYQWNNAQTPANNNDQSRYRLRVRLGADYQFAENWKAGVRLETGTKSDSANTDLGGYFSKDNAGIYVGLAYLEYETAKPTLFGEGIADYLDFRAGKILQPYFNNDLLWYSEVNPEGFAEQIGWKDVSVDGFDVNLRGGEFITSNVDETKATAGSDAFLFVAQAEGKYHFEKDAYVTLAPSFISETNDRADTQDGGGA
ncbi:MAG: putative porin, partial [Verrucomicrobiales bacterium]|nr:putative porin [Verrucomicrobiales bacterium]